MRSPRFPVWSHALFLASASVFAGLLLACSSDDSDTGGQPSFDAGDATQADAAGPDSNVSETGLQESGPDGVTDSTGDQSVSDSSAADAPTPDPAIHFVGRHESSGPGQARFGWSGTGLVARFDGTALRVRMDNPQGAYTVVVDDAVQTPLETTAGFQTYTLASGLAPGEHVVQMLRRAEGHAGVTSVEKVEIDGQLLAPPPVTRRIEVLGDSITCGYGNEGADQYCHFSYDTENHYLTYGAVAARAVGAELSTIAWSGKGVIFNYGDDKDQPLPEVYERTIPTESSGIWDFHWQADVVLVNLGTNDFSTDGDPTEGEFVTAYVALLEKLRSKYPNALLLCTIAPLLWGDDKTTSEAYVQKAVEQRAEEGDSHVKRIDLSVDAIGQGCDWHPSAATHAAMGAKLVTVLHDELGW